LDALWAPFAGTGKILASFFRNTTLGGAVTVVVPPRTERARASKQRTTIDRGERERGIHAVQVSQTVAVE
jgi:hypothetical protein